MYCQKCDIHIDDSDAQYCSHCGNVLSEDRYRIKLVKAECRKITNLNKKKLANILPTIKQMIYSEPTGDYWIFLKVGKLEGFEAFRLNWAKYEDFNGKKYIGNCVDVHNEKGQKMCNCLLLLVRKDDDGIKYLEYSKIEEVMQIGFLSVFCILLAIAYCILMVVGMFSSDPAPEMFLLFPGTVFLVMYAFIVPIKLGKTIKRK